MTRSGIRGRLLDRARGCRGGNTGAHHSPEHHRSSRVDRQRVDRAHVHRRDHPGVLAGIGLMVVTPSWPAATSRRGPPQAPGDRWLTRRAVVVLIMPLIVMGGILGACSRRRSRRRSDASTRCCWDRRSTRSIKLASWRPSSVGRRSAPARSCPFSRRPRRFSWILARGGVPEQIGHLPVLQRDRGRLGRFPAGAEHPAAHPRMPDGVDRDPPDHHAQ